MSAGTDKNEDMGAKGIYNSLLIFTDREKWYYKTILEERYMHLFMINGCSVSLVETYLTF